MASSTVAYGTSLAYGGGEIVLQAGAASESATLGVEGVNGYCGPVLFSSPSAPEGVSFQASTAYTGESAVLTVSAKATAPSVESGSLVISGRASGVSSSRVTIPVTVLPSQGEIPVRVISGGYKSVSLARVDWNGRTLYSTIGGGPGRGINIISVNPSTGVFSSVQNFDTWEDETASTNIIRYLAGLPDGTLILAAIADEGTYLLSQDARNAFAILFGSTAIESLGYQESWALISRKNAGKPIAEASSSDSQVVLDKVLTLPFAN
ncbi:MAG: interleukin-like EMT inducer domain-containing protein [Bryobacteraceae bacterium]